MADFRRYLTVLAVLALMAGAASAQIGVANGSASTLLACNASAAAIPELRPEGYTELVGDIVITCTGGPIYAVGSIIPTTNITVSISPGVPITSRFLSAGPGTGFSSDVLLIIDEPGSTVATGVAGAYGPRAPQLLCNTSNQIIANNTSCPQIVSQDPGTAGGPYLVAAQAAAVGSAASANVYQGRVNAELGAQSVTFYNVPVLPPATSGVSRTYRITNIRVPVAGGGIPGAVASPVTATIVTGTSTALPISQTTVTVAVVGRPLTAGVSKPSSTTQCKNPTLWPTATLTFTEGFATAFKTRVVPGGALNLTPSGATNTAYAAEATNTVSPNNQNVPGGLYGGFAQNSESGFIFPALTNGTSTAGLTDFGTRLKAVFYNIPAGLTLYVSNTATNAAPAVVGGTSQSPFAVLVATNTTTSGEATADGSAFGIGNVVGGTATPQVALTADSTGKAWAVWEVTNSNPAANDVLTFGVYISYTAAAATTANPYGTPITDLSSTVPVPGQAVNDVQLSFAPEPGGGSFTSAQGPVGTLGIPIPRFVALSTFEGKYITITPCSTSLLYPYITGAAGFDSGISVANTSWDPFNTAKQAGSCTLYAYGVTVAAAGNTAIQQTINGCDQTPTPLEGTNCFGVVPAGQVKSLMASSSQLANFQGYVIALCNFQYAHGYAAVTDLGLRNLWSSYLALQLNNAVGTPSGQKARGSGIEVLAH